MIYIKKAKACMTAGRKGAYTGREAVKSKWFEKSK